MRTGTRNVLSAAIVAFALVHATASSAAPTKALRDELQDAAREKYDAAVELAKAGKWAAARTEFYRSYELSKNPRLLFNVAVSEKNLEHFHDAITTFRRELEEGKGKISAEEDLRVRQNIEALEKFVGSITLEVNEPGASVLVENEELPEKTPITHSIPLSTGIRTITIKKPGFEPVTKRVDVSSGRPTDLKIVLEPIQRSTDVEIQVQGPATATIVIDNNDVGFAGGTTTYKGKVSVRSEPHSFSARALGYDPATESKVAIEGQKIVLTLSMARKQDLGVLVVDAQPAGAVIMLDGKPAGANHWEGPVSGGSHQVAVKKDGFYTRLFDVDVPAGGRRTVSASLDENKSTGWLAWVVGTTVVVAGASVAGYFLFKSNDDNQIPGSLRRAEQIPVGTQLFRFR